MKKVASSVLLLLLLFGCVIASHIDIWSSLIRSPSTLTLGCWDVTYWTGPSSPGHYQDFMEWGLKLNSAHPQFFTTINKNGDLEKPGYQGPSHRGAYSVDYTELLKVTSQISSAGLFPTIGLFIHNFENINNSSFEKFLSRFSHDLKKLGIKKVILIPAWDIQGQWPAWEDGSTRDCYIDPVVFNKQIKMMVSVRDKIKADNILMGCAIAADYDSKSMNKYGKSASDYIEGLKECDIVGINAYPTKLNGAKWAFENAGKLHNAVGIDKPIAFFEYSIETHDYSNNQPINWSDDEIEEFIRNTYELLKQHPFVNHIDWWFIGKSPGARIRIK